MGWRGFGVRTSLCGDSDHLVFTGQLGISGLTAPDSAVLTSGLVLFWFGPQYLLVLLAFIRRCALSRARKNCQHPYKMPKAHLFSQAPSISQIYAGLLQRQIIVNLIDRTGDGATAAETIEKMIDDEAAIVKKPQTTQ